MSDPAVEAVERMVGRDHVLPAARLIYTSEELAW